MALVEYGRYTLISRPHFDASLRVWVPYASIYWHVDDGFRCHRLTDFNDTFSGQEEAVAFGFAAARAWIDKERGTYR
jgi:hypothetical protein